MTKLLSMIIAAAFAAASFSVVAADAKKPTAEQCKKDPKMKGCEEMKKK
jgi:Ni/Co efflux regulator RcnB